MKVSESWLTQWVNTPLKGQALADRLTMAGLEVDAVNRPGGTFSDVVVAHVLETKSHPQADRLTICQVAMRPGEVVQVVCGATNVRANLKVALACVGAVLPGGMLIKASQLRGELSEGMICSASELGLEASSEGILELPEDAPLGMSLNEYLQLDDHILSIELTPNRADCFSIRGIAREVAALTGCECTPPVIHSVPAQTQATRAVRIFAEEACRGYALRLIQGINPLATTPIWMQERLRRAGIRPIHPAVDVTQYVMIEFGQPMHAFDASCVVGNMQVRWSQPGEQLVLLDGQTVTFNEEVLLVADDQHPLAMAGVMGGLHSAVGPNTTDVLLESAFFEPAAIAGVARKYGLCTEASQRFERGVDPALHREMIDYATSLLINIAGGKPGVIEWKHAAHVIQESNISFRPKRVAELTGLSIPASQMQAILESLGMSVVIQVDAWEVRVPSFRFDLCHEVDLVEEIARIYGYDALPDLPALSLPSLGQMRRVGDMRDDIANYFKHRGYHEIISYSFVDPEVQAVFYPARQKLNLLNPLSSELSEMRLSLWPGLISALLQNVSRQQVSIRLFEIGVVFDMHEGILSERTALAGLISGQTGALNWAQATHDYDFYDMKGDLEALFSGSASQLNFVPESLPSLHPGKSARLYLNDAAVGWIGALHPALAETFDLDQEVILFEVELEKLETNKRIQYQPISKYPQVRRDLSLLVDVMTTAAQVEQVVRASIIHMSGILRAFYVFDQYIGEQVPSGKKSLAIALIFQDEHRTLTDTDITALMQSVVTALQLELGVQVRDGGQ